MRLEKMVLAATLVAAFALSGCKALENLTGPGDGLTGPDTFSLTTNMSNSTGDATILDAQILIDNNVVADSCPDADEFPDFDPDGNQVGTSCSAPAVATATLSTAGHIGPGTHTMRFFISSQTTNYTRTPYTVLPFTIRVVDQNGVHLPDINLAGQAASLQVGGSIDYTFTI
jgi:hypothetical protein